MWDDVGMSKVPHGAGPVAGDGMRMVALGTVASGCALWACTHVLTPVPADWKQPAPEVPRPAAVVAAIVPTEGGTPDADQALAALVMDGGPLDALDGGAPGGLDLVALEDGLRARVKPPSLCFHDPGACGIAAPALSLAALRPLSADLDVLEAALKEHGTRLPEESRWLHCESLAAWRPASGRACVEGLLAEDRLLKDAPRLRALAVADVMGREGDTLVNGWLRHEDRMVRRDAAAWVSARAMTDDAVMPLLEALNMEPDQQTAILLIGAFATLRDPRAVEMLNRIARGDAQVETRVAAIDVLTDLAGPRVRTRLLTIPAKDPRIKAAVLRSLERINGWLDGSQDPFKLAGAFDFMASSPKATVGAVAFLETFENHHDRGLQWSSGEKLTAQETDELLRRLEDAGGYGLAAVRSTLAVSLNNTHLARLLDIRRAIFAAGQPGREGMLRDLMEVARVVREHYVMGRGTRYWRRALHSDDSMPLKFHP